MAISERKIWLAATKTHSPVQNLVKQPRVDFALQINQFFMTANPKSIKSSPMSIRFKFYCEKNKIVICLLLYNFLRKVFSKSHKLF